MYMSLKSIDEIIMESMDFYWSISNKISRTGKKIS